MRILIGTLWIVLTLNSCAQNIDCKSVWVGTFETPTQSVGLVEVERNDSLHIETVPQINKQTISKVIWLDDCNFRLEHYKGDVPPGPIGQKPIICEIIEIGKGYHIVRSKIEGTDIQNDYRMNTKEN
jgi:hypothetical protein